MRDYNTQRERVREDYSASSRRFFSRADNPFIREIMLSINQFSQSECGMKGCGDLLVVLTSINEEERISLGMKAGWKRTTFHTRDWIGIGSVECTQEAELERANRSVSHFQVA